MIITSITVSSELAAYPGADISSDLKHIIKDIYVFNIMILRN